MPETTTETLCRHCGRSIVREDGAWIDPEATGDDAVWREVCDSHDTMTAEHEPYESQSARDAQASGYGGPSYWDYLDQAAAEHADYFRRHGDEGRAAEMMTQSLGEALRGNEGI